MVIIQKYVKNLSKSAKLAGRLAQGVKRRESRSRKGKNAAERGKQDEHFSCR